MTYCLGQAGSFIPYGALRVARDRGRKAQDNAFALLRNNQCLVH